MHEWIEALTVDQRHQMWEHVARWVEIGRSTRSADRTAFEEAARECYRHAGLAWHGRVAWVESPLVLELAVMLAELMALPPGTEWPVRLVQARAGHSPHRRLPTWEDPACEDLLDLALVRVGLAFQNRLGDRLRRWMERQLLGNVQIGFSLTDSAPTKQDVYAALSDPSWVAAAAAAAQEAHGRVPSAKVLESLEPGFWRDSPFHHQVRREHRAGMAAWGSFLREVCQLELPQALWDQARVHEQMVRSAAYWYPHRAFILACDWPREIHHERLDWRSSRLHREDGPALSWRDGWTIHFIHGSRQPASNPRLPPSPRPVAF